ncbi:MAG TPA: parallel beta-helix domain-containing protein [Rhizobacter sp.]|nr:parallel beta-helix domain-containing protein [Rhizobacter sp.]
MKQLAKLSVPALVAAVLAACGGGGDDAPAPAANVVTVSASQMTTTGLNAVLNAAANGSTISLPAGKYSLLGPLQLANKNGITIVGAGNGYDPSRATILSFKNALTQNGLSATQANNLTLRNFAVEDASGNGVFVAQSNTVVMDTLRAEWTTDPLNTSTMAYGLYPVGSDNVKVTNSIVAGTRDAGVYVGQSTNIRVSYNDVHDNVAGVEIENSHNAIVEGNNVHNNTGGILVFALTGPTRFLDTTDVKVVNNIISGNNLPPAANATGLVLTIPPGTGVMILASQNVEVSGNTIADHLTTGVLTVTAIGAGIDLTGVGGLRDSQGKGYDPYTRGVSIHHNSISNFGSNPGGAFADPAGLGPFTQGVLAGLGGAGMPAAFGAVLWDGIVDAATATTAPLADGSLGAYGGNLQVCSQNNTVTPSGATSATAAYQNMDINLISLISQAGLSDSPFFAPLGANATRLACTITLPAVTLPAGI